MKYILLALVLAACATEPKMPVACQKNLQYCLSAYDSQQGMSREHWNLLCKQDCDFCRSEWGQR